MLNILSHPRASKMSFFLNMSKLEHTLANEGQVFPHLTVKDQHRRFVEPGTPCDQDALTACPSLVVGLLHEPGLMGVIDCMFLSL